MKSKKSQIKYHQTLPRRTVERTIYDFPPSKYTAKSYLFQNENPEFNLNPESQTPFFEKSNLRKRTENLNISKPKVQPWNGFLDCTAQDREAQHKFHNETWSQWKQGRNKDLKGLTNLESLSAIKLNSEYYQLNRTLTQDKEDRKLLDFQRRTLQRVQTHKEMDKRNHIRESILSKRKKKDQFRRNKVKFKSSVPGKADFTQSENLLKTDTLKNKLLNKLADDAEKEADGLNQENFTTVREDAIPSELVARADGKSRVEIMRWNNNRGEVLDVVFEIRKVKFD